MIRVQKNLFTTLNLLSLILLSSGCVPKNADGTYHSAYSYHPYNRHQILREPISNNHRYQTQHFNSNNSTPIGESIEHIAKSLLGRDYKYGASGPYQYDCSGFTKYVFSKEGITLPRTSKEQSKVGEYIRANDLQKGDLIFFDSKKSAEVSHVGIYLSRGYFIHASSSKDQVTISNLNSNYYSKHFKWGRRVINMHYARR